jgi:hypothetical protein
VATLAVAPPSAERALSELVAWAGRPGSLGDDAKAAGQMRSYIRKVLEPALVTEPDVRLGDLELEGLWAHAVTVGGWTEMTAASGKSKLRKALALFQAHCILEVRRGSADAVLLPRLHVAHHLIARDTDTEVAGQAFVDLGDGQAIVIDLPAALTAAHLHLIGSALLARSHVADS